MRIWAASLLALASLLAVPGRVSAQAPPVVDPLHKPFDELLDVQVRDGLVYYRALRASRAGLDRYVASLNGPAVARGYKGWPRERQIAFWLNAYNAFVLKTVIDHYPVRGVAPGYPAQSIRQIAGAFDRISHRAAGRSLTLDAIEKTLLAGFNDPRLYLAIGRGAVGAGRLRSEAFSAARLEAQLAEVVREFPTRPESLQIDQATGRILVSSIVSWHEAEFVGAYADKAPPAFAGRSPVERAVVGLLLPHLLAGEREFVEKNQFTIGFQVLDWRLNDLTTGARPQERTPIPGHRSTWTLD